MCAGTVPSALHINMELLLSPVNRGGTEIQSSWLAKANKEYDSDSNPVVWFQSSSINQLHCFASI